jgi:hypothetical protein
MLAQTNVFASSLAESTVALGYVHGNSQLDRYLHENECSNRRKGVMAPVVLLDR